MCIALEGQDHAHGWLTAVTKDGVENVGVFYHEVIASKPPLVRSGCELHSDKVGELAAGARVHVLERRTLADGTQRACIALPGQGVIHGWLTSTTKDQAENLRPLPVSESASAADLVGSETAPPPAALAVRHSVSFLRFFHRNNVIFNKLNFSFLTCTQYTTRPVASTSTSQG